MCTSKSRNERVAKISCNKVFSFTHLYLICLVHVEQWREYTPEWCGGGYRREIQRKGITEEECKQRCSNCTAIEYWSGGSGYCFECLDHTKRIPYTNTADAAYPPHVFVRE